MADVAAVLNAAADLLERDGWIQGTYHDTESTAQCAAAALYCVYADKDTLDAAYDALRETLPVRDGGRMIVSEWNDQAGRTAAEVIAALRDAARHPGTGRLSHTDRAGVGVGEAPTPDRPAGAT